ncbi:MAG TPA: response regulator [Acidimicrobiia bacterium]|jgi:DNA-binding response OmpR family regulator|nr:response regulator [Acidimicrobiia bacterium]
MRQSILVVDRDADHATWLVSELERFGFAAEHAATAAAALMAAERGSPDMVLLDPDLPRGSGPALLRSLATGRATTATPVIVLSADGATETKVRRLRAGADDYVEKPYVFEELVARIRTVLRRAKQLRNLSPLTGLPGNAAIADTLRTRVGQGRPVAVAHVDITDFKTFNDAYGFLRGDRVISFCAECLRKSAAAANGDVFLGHIGGDDFVAILDALAVDAYCKTLIEYWDSGIDAFYDAGHAAAGIVATDRRGHTGRYPVATLAIGVATNLQRSFGSEWEASAVAAEMKEFAKRQPGSNYQVDRRTG